MFLHKVSFIRYLTISVWIVLVLVVAACAPQTAAPAPTQAPLPAQPTATPVIIDKTVVPFNLTVVPIGFSTPDLFTDQQMKEIQGDFRAQLVVEPYINSATDGLNKRLKETNAETYAAKFDWEMAAPVFASAEGGGEFRVLAQLAPVRALQADYFSVEHLQALKENSQNLVVGALVTNEVVAAGLAPGSYLLEWLSLEDQVCLTDAATGKQHCGTPEYCVEEVTEIQKAITTIESGSTCFCARFDSRKCCVCFEDTNG
jgi:hypothetical protein